MIERGIAVLKTSNLLDSSNLLLARHYTELEEINSRYVGIQADFCAWPEVGLPLPALSCGLAEIELFEYIQQYASRLLELFPFDTFKILAINYDRQDIIDNAFFCGYECGYYVGENNHYSSIYNDILLGDIFILKKWSMWLNKKYLFPTKQIAHAYLMEHNRLLDNNFPLECDEIFYPISITQLPMSNLTLQVNHNTLVTTFDEDKLEAAVKLLGIKIRTIYLFISDVDGLTDNGIAFVCDLLDLGAIKGVSELDNHVLFKSYSKSAIYHLNYSENVFKTIAKNRNTLKEWAETHEDNIILFLGYSGEQLILYKSATSQLWNTEFRRQ